MRPAALHMMGSRSLFAFHGLGLFVLKWRMEVTDEFGLVLFRLAFQVMESPAMMGSSQKSVR